MIDKYIEQIVEKLNDLCGWMKDPISIVVDANITLDDLIENSDDVYEVVVDIHLINGDVVTLKNECLRSFEKKRYMGAEIELDYEPGNIMVNIYIYGSVYHSIGIPISSICWIDSHSEDIDWKEYKEKIKQVAGVEEVMWLDNVVNIAQPLDSFDKKTVETYYQEKHALLTLIITEDKNIRETVAFPLNQNGEDVLTGTPNEVTELQLRETHIKLR